MNNSVQTISLLNLTLAFIPVVAAIGILLKWSLAAGKAIYAISRMLVQLLLIGYFLSYIFQANSAVPILLVLAVMVFASGWIALGTVSDRRKELFRHALCSILLGGGSTLILITQGVLSLDPWFWPQYMIPLAGMIFANSMTGISLAAERLKAELKGGVEYGKAQGIALQTALIPITNTLFAVGLVSLPGMMTGQILSGVSPLIAARYQIMVMCMIFGSITISVACFLTLARPAFERGSQS